MKSQGYQIIAMGHEDYAIMAESCAISIRHNDPDRPIQIVTDRPIQIVTDRPERFDSYGKKLFDVVTPCLEEDLMLKGPLIKLKAHKYTVFDCTLFVDCDCIMFKPVDAYWEKLAAYDFTVQGSIAKRGEWYKVDIEDLCRQFNTPYVVRMNSGAIYFNKVGFKVFDYAWSLYEKHGNFLNHDHKGSGAPDEPYLGITMGKLGLSTLNRKDDGPLMMATMNSRNYDFDWDNKLVKITKNDGKIHAPYIAHFTSCEPRQQYIDLIRKMRNYYGLSPKFSFLRKSIG